MAQNSFPFENADTTETQYSRLFSELQDTGVAGDTIANAGIAVSVGTGMGLVVSAGFAIIRGFAYENTENLPLTVDAADLANPRIDTVVLRLDPTNNNITAVIKKGTPGATPSAPALTQIAGAVWEMPLADILVPTSSTALSGANLTDRRSFLGSRVGYWRTATRPVGIDHGTFGFNVTTGKFEWYDAQTTAWSSAVPFDLTDGSVTAAKLASNSVTTAKITDANVTTAKLADTSVTGAKLADGSVATAKLADVSVTDAKLANNSVTTAKVADTAITDAKLAVPPRRYVAVEVNANTTLTLTTAAAGKIIRATNGGGLAVTVNSSSLAEGDRVDFIQASTAPVTFVPGVDVTLVSKDNKRKTNGTWSAVSLVRVNDGQYLLVGDIAA